MVTPVVSTPSAGVVYVFNRVARVRAAAQVLHACATSNAHRCYVPPLASVINGRGLELGLHYSTMTANIAMQLFRSFRVFGKLNATTTSERLTFGDLFPPVSASVL